MRAWGGVQTYWLTDNERFHPVTDATDGKGVKPLDLTAGQIYWPPLGSSSGHGWAVLLAVTGQNLLAIDRTCSQRLTSDLGSVSAFAIVCWSLRASGWGDLNSRPLDPQSTALTKLRHSPHSVPPTRSR